MFTLLGVPGDVNTGFVSQWPTFVIIFDRLRITYIKPTFGVDLHKVNMQRYYASKGTAAIIKFTVKQSIRVIISGHSSVLFYLA